MWFRFTARRRLVALRAMFSDADAVAGATMKAARTASEMAIR